MATRRNTDASPQLLTPLPATMLAAWQAELEGTGVDARAHWWALPHWLPHSLLVAADTPHALLAETVKHIMGTSLGDFGGVEMWIQRRGANSAMHLHWDMDEERVRLQHQLRTPAVSVVVYLSDEGGPTLVLRQQLRAPREGPRRCWCVWPHAGMVCKFSGDYMHGVLGDPDGQDSGSSRHTLLLNFWRRRPRGLSRLPAVLMPREDPDRAPQPAATTRPPPTGPLRIRQWRLGESEAWPCRQLLLGTYDETQSLTLRLPPSRYSGKQLEAFLTVVRTSDTHHGAAPSAGHAHGKSSLRPTGPGQLVDAPALEVLERS
tara:strand:+ start:1497 stop:2450 length:954 start_codon:yes stop_codon:yes gene_type:complete